MKKIVVTLALVISFGVISTVSAQPVNQIRLWQDLAVNEDALDDFFAKAVAKTRDGSGNFIYRGDKHKITPAFLAWQACGLGLMSGQLKFDGTPEEQQQAFADCEQRFLSSNQVDRKYYTQRTFRAKARKKDVADAWHLPVPVVAAAEMSAVNDRLEVLEQSAGKIDDTALKAWVNTELDSLESNITSDFNSELSELRQQNAELQLALTAQGDSLLDEVAVQGLINGTLEVNNRELSADVEQKFTAMLDDETSNIETKIVDVVKNNIRQDGELTLLQQAVGRARQHNWVNTGLTILIVIGLVLLGWMSRRRHRRLSFPRLGYDGFEVDDKAVKASVSYLNRFRGQPGDLRAAS